MASNGLKLKVVEAKQRDVGRKIARISEAAMRKAGIETGDYVELKGPKGSALAQVYPSYDIGPNEVRIDGYLRKTINVSIGDEVTVSKAEVTPAAKVVLAPTQPIRFDESFVEYVKDQLMNKPITKGEVIPLPIYTGTLDVVVINTQPSNYVFVSRETSVELREEPVKEAGVYPKLPGRT